MTLQQTLKQIGADFAALTPNCYHYWRPHMKPPFIVWQEADEGNDFGANNRKAERLISGGVHYFTSQEYDPMVDQIEQLLNKKTNGWMLESVQYEEDTNLIHHEWSWQVAINKWGDHDGQNPV